MNPQMQDFLLKSAEELKAFLAKMADQMGVAVEHLYGVLIRQQFMVGIEQMCYWLFALVIFFILLHHAKKMIKRANEVADEKGNKAAEGYFGGAIVLWIATGICALFVIFGFGGWFTDGIKHLSNPEYYALQDIFDFIKSNASKVTK